MSVSCDYWPVLGTLPLLVFCCWRLRQGAMAKGYEEGNQAALFLRGLLVTLLVLTLAGMRANLQHDRQAVVFVVDASRSLDDAQRGAIRRYLTEAARHRHSPDLTGVIAFAENSDTLLKPNGADQDIAGLDLRVSGLAAFTDIAQALRQARSLLQSVAPEWGRRIVLLSDGNENRERAMREAPSLAAEGIALDTVTIAPNARPEALIAKTVLPARVHVGEPFAIRLVVRSLTAQTAALTLTRDGRSIGGIKHVALAPGRRVVVWEDTLEHAGIARYVARLDCPQDTWSENNRGEGVVRAQGKPTVLYVTDSETWTRAWRDTLTRQNITVEYTSPERLPDTPLALQRYDSVFLSNVPASRLTLRQMTALQIACHDLSVGFGMVGGENSFGAGGYRGTPIEPMLPVRLDTRPNERAVSVVFALDRSGSMDEKRQSGESKLQMAKRAAIRAIAALDAQDKAAVIAFDATAAVQMPLTSVSHYDALLNAVRAIELGGGTRVYQGAQRAYEVIAADTSPVKHVILLTDGQSNDPDYASLIARFKSHHITVSSVIVGGGTRADYVQTLGRLSQETGGRFYLAPNARQLPDIYLQEIKRIAAPPIREEAFRAAPVAGGEPLGGIDWAHAPPLRGYNVSSARPTANVSLVSSRNEPILASGRYGVGRTVAFLSDDRPRWAARWIGWAGYARFWAQVARWTLRPPVSAGLTAQITAEDGQGHLIVEAQDAQNGFRSDIALRARILSPDAAGHTPATERLQPDTRSGEAPENSREARAGVETRLIQTQPGRYEAWFDASETGTYLAHIFARKPDGAAGTEEAVAALTIPYPPEYAQPEANRVLMRNLALAANGRVDPPAQAIFDAARRSGQTSEPLSSWLLAAALVFLPFDIALRRRAAWRGSR